MRTSRSIVILASLGGMALSTTMVMRTVLAQGPETQNGGGQQRGFQGRGGTGGGFGGGGFGGQMPFAMGTVSGGDIANGRITIQSQFGGNAQTIVLGDAAQMVKQTTVTVADLAVDDQVQLQGVPTGISAASIVSGQMPPAFTTMGRRPQGGGPQRQGGVNAPGANPGADANGANGAAANAGTGTAFATGRITAVNPLTISIGNGVSVTVTLAANAKVTKIVPTSIKSLKAGDRLMATGQTSQNGSFVATGIAVNMDMGAMGPGGIMMPGGPGFGGPGGFGGGRGGFGGGPGGGGFGGQGGGPGNQDQDPGVGPGSPPPTTR